MLTIELFDDNTLVRTRPTIFYIIHSDLTVGPSVDNSCSKYVKPSA